DRERDGVSARKGRDAERGRPLGDCCRSNAVEGSRLRMLRDHSKALRPRRLRGTSHPNPFAKPVCDERTISDGIQLGSAAQLAFRQKTLDSNPRRDEIAHDSNDNSAESAAVPWAPA